MSDRIDSRVILLGTPLQRAAAASCSIHRVGRRNIFTDALNPDVAVIEPSSNTGLLAQFEPTQETPTDVMSLEFNDFEEFAGVSAFGSLFGKTK